MKYIIPVTLFALLTLAGCGGRETMDTAMETPEAEPVENVVELTAEEAELLEPVQADSMAEEPITSENYEEALRQLEEAVEAEQ